MKREAGVERCCCCYYFCMRHEIWRSAFSCGSSGAVDDMVLFVRSVAAACNKDTFESEVSSEYTGGIDFLRL